MSEFQSLYEKRPFKTRNADEYDISRILDLFVSPANGLMNPFEYENSIVKGRMGSGKTMYLRANYAYHLYSIMPALIIEKPPILPVFLKLSDFQQIKEPEKIYSQIIIKIIEKLLATAKELQDATQMMKIHRGMQTLPDALLSGAGLDVVRAELTKLSADEYVEKVTKSARGGAALKRAFIEAFASYQKDKITEVKRKPEPGFGDIVDAYDHLLARTKSRVLLLMDEVGSIDKSFFREDGKHQSMFEVLMNQLRTAEFIRVKIAIYPQTYSDLLTETRYGDVISLEDDIVTDDGYKRFRKRAVDLITRYLSDSFESHVVPADLFESYQSKQTEGDALEQIINASGGNIRRLVQLLDLSMEEAYLDHQGKGSVKGAHVEKALKKHASKMLDLHGASDKEYLEIIAKACRSRGTFRFQFPYASPALFKYTAKSDEQNILKISELGSGRRGTTYEFDYSFCVSQDIPTHYVKESERIDKTRSRMHGAWIRKTTNISEELLEHVNIPGKRNGVIDWWMDDKQAGLIKGEDGQQYFMSQDRVINVDKGKKIHVGKQVRFFDMNYQGVLIAHMVEVL